MQAEAKGHDGHHDSPSKKRARACLVEVEEIEDQDSAPNIAGKK